VNGYRKMTDWVHLLTSYSLHGEAVLSRPRRLKNSFFIEMLTRWTYKIDQPINVSTILHVIDMQLVFSNMHCNAIWASALYIRKANKTDERLSNKCNLSLLCFEVFLISSSTRNYCEHFIDHFHRVIIYIYI